MRAPCGSGATLVEVLVGLAVLLLLMALAGGFVWQTTRSEKATEGEAALGLQQSLLYEALSNDLHSSFEVQEDSQGRTFKIGRYVDKGDEADKATVTYTVDPDRKRITRSQDGERDVVFEFSGATSGELKFQLDIRKIGSES